MTGRLDAALDHAAPVRRTAVLSDDGAYRYVLTRRWDDSKPLLAWCGLNPSIANDVRDDPTMVRIRRFTDDWGYGGLVMLNVFPLIATKPAVLRDDPDRAFGAPAGPASWLLAAGLDTVLCWGANVSHPRLRPYAAQAEEALVAAASSTFCVGRTAAGYPKHPLYLPSTTEPEPW